MKNKILEFGRRMPHLILYSHMYMLEAMLTNRQCWQYQHCLSHQAMLILSTLPVHSGSLLYIAWYHSGNVDIVNIACLSTFPLTYLQLIIQSKLFLLKVQGSPRWSFRPLVLFSFGGRTEGSPRWSFRPLVLFSFGGRTDGSPRWGFRPLV